MDAPESPDFDTDPEARIDLQTLRIGYGDITQQNAVRANRRWWDDEADTYQAEHGAFLAGALELDIVLAAGAADFVWCPEGLREADVALLGPLESLVGHRVLEIGLRGRAMRTLARAVRG